MYTLWHSCSQSRSTPPSRRDHTVECRCTTWWIIWWINDCVTETVPNVVCDSWNRVYRIRDGHGRGNSFMTPGSSASTKNLSTYCKNVKKTHTAQLTQERNLGSTAPKQNLLCLYCNTRSLYYKIDELEAMIEDVTPDLIFITETWLHPDIKNAEVMLSGFSEPIRKDWTGRRGGGCIMYAKQGLMLREENTVGSEDTESVWATLLSGNGSKTTIGLCYVPPNDRIKCQTTPHLSWSVQGQQAVCNYRRLQPPDNCLRYTQGRTRRPRIPGSCPWLLSNPTRMRTDSRGKHTRPDPQHRGTHDRRHHDPTTPLKQRPQRHQLQSYSGRKTVRKQYDKDCGLQQSRLGGNTGRTRTSRVGWVDNRQRNNRGEPGDIHHHPGKRLQGHPNKKENE